MKKLILLLFLLLFISCNKEIKSTKGTINIVTTLYFNASQGLNDVRQIRISRMDYYNDNLIEYVPNALDPQMIDQVFYIKDSLFYNAGSYQDSKTLSFREKQFYNKPFNLSKKSKGAVWVNVQIFDYEKRKNLTDTLLYSGRRAFKRFEINSPDNYSIYYLAKTDTLLPYSFNRIAEQAYKGRLERIDSYDKKKDLFSTILLIHSPVISKDALQVFKYNEELEKEFEQAKNRNKI